MVFWQKGKNRMLGVDFGSSSFKIVELASSGTRAILEGYAVYSERGLVSLPAAELGRMLAQIVRTSQVKAGEMFLALPVSSTFVVSFELPFMSREEIPQAVMSEARQRIPVPVGEVELDWTLISDVPQKNRKSLIEILLLAVPKEIIARYNEIAKNSGLKLAGVESELFSMARALARAEIKPAMIVDIGSASTSIVIVKGTSVLLSHNFWIGGGELTTKIMQSTGQTFEQAEYYKKKVGVSYAPSESIKHILIPFVDDIITESEKVMAIYGERFKSEIGLVILTGGGAAMAGLKNLFAERLGREVVVRNPFADIFYPPILSQIMKETGPVFSVATGLALRGLE